MSDDVIVAMQDVRKSYGADDTAAKEESMEYVVLQDINLTVHRGDYISIMGRSGSGKSTLLNLIGLLLPATDGSITWDGREVGSLWDSELADIRRRDIGFVFQDFQLIRSLSLLDNIMLPALLNKSSEEDAESRAKELASTLELNDALLQKRPGNVSGGERQRAAIARALINDPKLILADEPTGNLDEKSAGIVAGMLRRVHEKMNKAIVLVTHNPSLAADSQKMYYLMEGRLGAPVLNQGDRDAYYRKILAEM